MTTISFARHRFPPAIIRHAVWLYVRFTLSFRDVEDLLAERGRDISYETVRRWGLKFGPLFARELRRRRHRPTSQWHLDEMAVVIGEKRFWLRRAVDDEGEVRPQPESQLKLPTFTLPIRVPVTAPSQALRLWPDSPGAGPVAPSSAAADPASARPSPCQPWSRPDSIRT